jgi:hypothetical protein
LESRSFWLWWFHAPILGVIALITMSTSGYL